MKSLAFATIEELRLLLDRKEVTAAELVAFYAQRFAKYDPSIGSALELFDTDSILKNSSELGELAGIPGILKDNICQTGRIASCGSKMLANYRSNYDATVTARLKDAGALIIGRANMDEFAMGSSNEYSAFKKCYNPWNLECVSGGSSGGSVAAVAAGLIPWSLGSETGGSVRLPAAFCGVVGIKPTYGLISRYGLVAYASSLDQIGVCTRTVEDNARVLSVIAGQDPKDSSSLNVLKQNFLTNLKQPLPKKLRIGLIENILAAEGLDPEVKSAVDAVVNFYESQGVEIKRISLPTLDYAAATYFIISRAEAASNLARFDGVRYGLRNKAATTLNDMYKMSRHDGFGDEVRLRILIGNYVLSEGHAGQFYVNAKKIQNMMRQEFVNAFKDVDLLITPSQAMPAFKVGAFDNNKLQMDLQDYFTCFANLAGVPAMTVPCGFSKSGLPIGFQLVGPHLSEALMYQVAYQYEQAHDWHKMHPENLL